VCNMEQTEYWMDNWMIWMGRHTLHGMKTWRRYRGSSGAQMVQAMRGLFSALFISLAPIEAPPFSGSRIFFESRQPVRANVFTW
jgi:hypothetical protein